jgi:hypothetical protein
MKREREREREKSGSRISRIYRNHRTGGIELEALGGGGLVEWQGSLDQSTGERLPPRHRVI